MMTSDDEKEGAPILQPQRRNPMQWGAVERIGSHGRPQFDILTVFVLDVDH